MYEMKLKFLPVLMVAASVAGAAEITPVMKDTINRVDVGRQEVDQRGSELVMEANELFADGRYMAAVKKYLQAIKEYDRYASGVFIEHSEYCRKRIAECYFRQAQEAMKKADELAQVSDYDEAIRLCREAIKYCPEQVDELNRLIALYEKRRDTAVDRDNTSAERLMPNLKAQEYQVQVLMEQGRKLSLNGEYVRAARKFQEVLLINPFNADALQSLSAVNERIRGIGVEKYTNEHRRLMGEVEWKKATPYQPFAEQLAHNLIDSGTVKAKPEEKGAALRRRLVEIKLPKVYLPETTVSDAVSYLSNESMKNDPNKRGVNIVYLRSIQSKQNTAQQQQENADGMAGGGEVPVPQQQDPLTGVLAELQPDERITLDLQNKNLLEALEILCASTTSPKMRYQVDEHAVLISPEDVAIGGMLTKSIQINLPEGTTNAEIENNMVADGIEFRPGAGVAYFPALGRVVIKNDSKNLELMEEFFERRKASEEMIQLQIKFVEMTQNDIDELAFNWQYAVNANTSRTTPNGDLSRATIIESSSNQLMRYYVPDEAVSSDPLSDATYSFIWANSDGTKITANMFALDWADSNDVLSSPRITTLSGQTAKIEMVTVRYFPEEWETIDVDTVIPQYGMSVTRVTPQPTLDKEMKLGVNFEIRPELTPDGLIKMKLDFPITTFADEWIIYDNTANDDDGDYIKMPVFNTRRINTDIMLYDGETIVLGGVNKDDTTTVNDKIPILGDLPVVGRLFQSKYSTSEKSSLLIFLSCRLVKPDGTAYYPDKQIERGVPNFGRIE